MNNQDDQSEGATTRLDFIKPARNRLIHGGLVLLFERTGKRCTPLEAGGNCPRGQKNDSVLC
jgi:hypothetical protein